MSGKAISSDLDVASSRASALRNASSSLQRSVSVDKDHQTTIRGNEKAFGAINEAHQTAQSIVNAINGASAQLQTVATNFQATDNEASRTLFSPLPKGLKR